MIATSTSRGEHRKGSRKRAGGPLSSRRTGFQKAACKSSDVDGRNEAVSHCGGLYGATDGRCTRLGPLGERKYWMAASSARDTDGEYDPISGNDRRGERGQSGFERIAGRRLCVEFLNFGRRRLRSMRFRRGPMSMGMGLGRRLHSHDSPLQGEKLASVMPA
jgi:hypothetical protein